MGRGDGQPGGERAQDQRGRQGEISGAAQRAPRQASGRPEETGCHQGCGRRLLAAAESRDREFLGGFEGFRARIQSALLDIARSSASKDDREGRAHARRSSPHGYDAPKGKATLGMPAPDEGSQREDSTGGRNCAFRPGVGGSFRTSHHQSGGRPSALATAIIPRAARRSYSSTRSPVTRLTSWPRCRTVSGSTSLIRASSASGMEDGLRCW